MIIAYTQEEFEAAKSVDELRLFCKHCKTYFFKRKAYIVTVINKTIDYSYDFCSRKCANNNRYPPIMKNCGTCNKQLRVKPRDLKDSKSGQMFCGRSCSAVYQNKHKTFGCRRSKLESWLEEQLLVLYPNLEFHFNQRDAIQAELDIYIPSLKLAFELNGIFHYEPIFGEEKLQKIQTNDARKFAACHEQGIGLCVIDTSSLIHLKPKKAQKYLDIICQIVNSKLSST